MLHLYKQCTINEGIIIFFSNMKPRVIFLNNYGFALRTIRESKNVSLESLSGSTISKSNLSKFETGQIDLTLNKFISVLNKLNVSFTEFELIANNYNLDTTSKLFDIVNTAYEMESILTLKGLAITEKDKWERDKNIRYKLNYIMIEALIHDIDKEKVNQEDVSFIIDYLFSCEIWGKYELVLYGNSMSILKYETIITLSKELIHKVNSYKKIMPNYETIINIITNTTIMSVEKNDKNTSFYFLSFLENADIPESFFLERTIICFVKGLLHIRFLSYDQGVVFCETSLNVMKSIGSDNYYLKFNNYFSEFTRNVS